MIVVDGEALNRACYNVLLWTPNKADAKATATGGFVRVNISSTAVELSATDDYLAVVSKCELLEDNLSGAGNVYLTGEQVKELEKNTREIAGKFSVDFSEYASQKPFDMEIYDDITDMIWSPLKKEKLSEFAIAPDRFTKFSLLKPRDSYPTDFQVVSQTGNVYIRWRYGTETVGLLKQLNRSVVANAYKPNEALWDD